MQIGRAGVLLRERRDDNLQLLRGLLLLLHWLDWPHLLPRLIRRSAGSLACWQLEINEEAALYDVLAQSVRHVKQRRLLRIALALPTHDDAGSRVRRLNGLGD